MNLLDCVNILAKKQIGDLSRLEHIKKTISDNVPLSELDRSYLDDLVIKHLDVHKENIITDDGLSDTTENTTKSRCIFCNKCGKSFDSQNTFCSSCGTPLIGKSDTRFQRPVEWKSESTTLILSIVLGLIGIPGVGHIYLGKVIRGITILICSVILFAIAVIMLAAFSLSPLLSLVALPILIAYFAIFIWQIFDAKKLCNDYNQFIEQNKRLPQW